MTRLLHLGPSLLVIASVTLFANAAPAMPHSTNPDSSPAPSFALYAQTENTQDIVRLDPKTLTDLPDETSLTMDDLYTKAWSEDGSVLVTIENQKMIVVRDGRTGAERRRFDAPEVIYLSRLSRDGTRLVVSATWHCYDVSCDPPRHYSYDTRDGHLISKVFGTGKEFGIQLFNRDANALYTVSIDRDNQREGSWPVQITAFDLNTGTERGTVTLSDIRVIQEPMRTIDQMQVSKSFTPALALSPDGSRLAAVDAASDAISIVETASLTATTHTIHQSESALTKAARWFGLLPTSAEAKYMDGRYMEALFSADANHLYIWGTEGAVDDETGGQTGRAFGLTLIDLRNGEIKTKAFGNHFIQNVRLASDGLSLYVTEAETIPWVAATELPFTLHLLDPQTLESLAARQFPGYVWIELIPTQRENS